MTESGAKHAIGPNGRPALYYIPLHPMMTNLCTIRRSLCQSIAAIYCSISEPLCCRPTAINHSTKQELARARLARLLEMGRVEEQPHEHTADGAGDGNGHDPRQQQQADSLKVDRLERAVAQTDTDRRARDTHGRRHGEGELREDQDRDGGTHLHGAPCRYSQSLALLTAA